ncbi:hypothetical protein COL60_16560 [Bacillus pseudomycoides]|nr:hypothetical protein COL60_16560 [Bacillus pseudomycoides]PFZ09847.1 hypothetical protein COL63_21390 [Bacillus pseudomycoides]
MINELSSRVYQLEESADVLKDAISMLEEKVNQKVDVTDVQQVIKRSEVIKKINESPSVGMDSTVRISLDGMVVAESVVEHTTDAIKITANDIQGVGTNETK